MKKDLLFKTSFLAAFLVLVLSVGFLAQAPMDPSSWPLTDATVSAEESISSPTPTLRDAPVFPSPEAGLPDISSTSPSDEEAGVAWNRTIAVQFRSPVEQKDLAWTISPAVAMTSSFDLAGMTFSLAHAAPFEACTEYTVGIAGVPTGPVMNPWTFTTFCGGSISIQSPASGEVWTGGSTHEIRWTQTQNDTRQVGWSLEAIAGGATTRIASGAATTNGTRSFAWQVPRANLTNVRVRACITTGLRPVPVLCDTSGPFTIDSTLPTLLGHSPPDGAVDVPLSLTLTATFSEPMEPAATASAFSIAPAATVASRVWTSPNVLAVRLEGLRNATSYAWAFRCSAVDRSLPGNPLSACSATHGFTTTLRGPDGTGGGSGGGNDTRSTIPGASLTLESPVGHETWTGGSTHGIPFAVVNNATRGYGLLFTASYRCVSGTCAGSIGTVSVTVDPRANISAEIPWTLPTIDASDVVVNVTAVNGTWIAWAEGGPITIDSTPPSVLAAGPSGPHVRADPAVAVTFSEPLVASSDSVGVTPAVSIALEWTSSYDAFAAALLGTAPCTPYTVSLAGLRDLSDPGNPLSATSWTLTTECPPAVEILSPDGGEDWTGNTLHDVRWSVTDPDDARVTITISCSIDGGADGFPNVVANGLVVDVGPGTYRWIAPPVDSGRVALRVFVSDPAGDTATDASAAVFTVDSTPPKLLASFPGDGSATAWAGRDAWFVFSERVDRASFGSGFRLVPNPGNVTLEWSVNEGRDTVLVGHAPFDLRRLYTASFPASARDDSDPGNALGIGASVRFLAVAPPPGPPPTALASGQGRVDEGDPAAFDATGSIGNITRYDWKVVDGDGRLVAVLVGPRATYTFPKEGQYWVTLTVTDASGASDIDTISIAVLPTPDWLLVLIAVAGITAAVGQSFSTERGRIRMAQLFLVPLYARRHRDELLEHETRGMIRGYILVHPGDSYTDIRRNLGLANGTLAFHLGVLEREGIVRSKTDGYRRLYFPREAHVPEDGGGLHEVQIRIVRAVREIPGMGIEDLAGALGVSRQITRYHVKALAVAGAIRLGKKGFRLRCYPPAAKDGTPTPAEGLESAGTRVQDS